jgi:hypothetical protein
MNSISKRIVLLVLLLSVFVVALPVGAQTGDPSAMMAQRVQLRDQLVTQAGGLLQKYNIPPQELNSLLPFIGKNDQAGLMSKLASFGLSQEQIGGLLTEAGPLIQQGLSSGIIQEFLAGQAVNQLEEVKIDPSEYDQYFKAFGDATSLEELLKTAGVPQNDLFAFVQRAEELRMMGLGANDFDHLVRVEAMMQAMSESNLGEDQWNMLIDAYFANPQLFDDQLKAAGIDPEAFVSGFLDAYGSAYAGYGFDETEMGAFIDQAFLENVTEFGNDPEALAAILYGYGFTDDEVATFVDAAGDPAALATLLGDMGYTADEVATFEADVEAQLTGGDTTGGDTTGGDSTGGDTTGGDSTGGDTTGGDSTGGEGSGG